MDTLISQLDAFWDAVVQAWTTGVFGYDIGRVLGALAIFFAFLLLRKLFRRFVTARLKALAKRTHSDLDDRLILAVRGPIEFVPVVMGVFFALQPLGLEGRYATFSEALVQSLIVITIFWALHKAVDPARVLIFQPMERLLGAELTGWLVGALKIAFILIGAAAVLELWGIQVAPLIAGLGLFGVAVALGAQDLFKNLIAGLLVLTERRFRVGDWIRADGVVEGTVEQIGFRSTMVRQFDNAPVHVPNAKLADNPVINYSAMRRRRIFWKIGVEYRTDAAQLREITGNIETYLKESGAFVLPPDAPCFVFVDAFNDSSIDIMLYCFTRTTVWREWLAEKEKLAYRVKEIVEGAGTGFAFPSRSIYVELPAGERADAFPLFAASAAARTE